MRTPFRPLTAAAAVLACLAGCSAAPAPAQPDSVPSPLTAVTALGEFATLDYCSLLDARLNPATPDSSFTTCQADFVQNGLPRTVTIGPLAATVDPNVRPYAYRGPVPDGVSVQQSSFVPPRTCARAITFADGVRLAISVTDTDNRGTDDDRCATADQAVGGALATVTGNRVKHTRLPDQSWGRVDSCAILNTSGLPGDANAGLAGHSCIKDKVSLEFAVVSQAPAGPSETLGHRTARVAADGAFCRVRTVQPSPAAPNRAEEATVSVVDTSGAGGDAACSAARTAAAAIFAKIP
ncbi:hypothetical protein [Amycolatopsis benzoatilytica]|uniref:hypothetical protein n=1 Tax=Amycolatopsis benzoatilytica TaxID=346045 RepID=UPI0003A14643|nr:hypothetical protein [Amycolatopsis benzoatilytica]